MSELNQKINQRDPHKRCILFKKTSTCKVGNLGSYIRRYLDETKKKENQQAKDNKPLYGQNVQNRLRQGIDYLTKEKNQGTLHAYGFIREEIYKEAGKFPNELTNEELGSAITAVWKRKVSEKNLKKAAHKIVFALDPEICEMMKLANIPIDETLLGIVEQTFRAYVEEFYPGQSLGYLAGIHHDKQHIHAHILLFPQTDQGQPINISHRSKTKVGNNIVRIDYQGFLKDSVERLAKRMYLERIKKPAATLELPIEYRAQRKMILVAAVKMTERELETSIKNKTPFDRNKFWSKVLEKKRILERTSGGKDGQLALRSALDGAYAGRLQDFEDLTPEKAKEILDKAISTKEKMEQRLKDNTKLGIITVRDMEAKSAPWESMRTLHRECYRIKKLLFKGKDIKWTVAAFLNDTEGRWYLKRMEHSDLLGKTMRHVFNDMIVAEQSSAILDNERSAYAGSIVLSPGWKEKKRAANTQAALLDQVKKDLQKQAEENIKKEKEKKDREREERNELMAMIQLMTIQILDCSSKIKNKKPLYLKQYEAWKTAGIEIPIALTEGVYAGPRDTAAPAPHIKDFIAEDRIGAHTGNEALAQRVKQQIAKTSTAPLPKLSEEEKQPKSVDIWTKDCIERILAGDLDALIDMGF